MNDLIAKLKAASEGSRELDMEIGEAIRLPKLMDVLLDKTVTSTKPNMIGLHWVSPNCVGNVSIPHYTTSLDAALTGEDIRTVIMLGDGRWEAHALDGNGNYHIGEGATEPLARRIAALKARGV